MSSELRWMENLISSFTTQALPEGISGADLNELKTRLQILHLGYEIRTRSVLEREFPRFQKVLPLEKWREIGRNFSFSEASDVEQLGLLPHRFYVSLKSLELLPLEKSALEKDYLVFQSRHAALQKALKLSDLETLNEDSLFRLQSTVQIQIENNRAWVVSRSRTQFFENEVSPELADLLLKLRENPTELRSIMDRLCTDSALSQFLVQAIQNYWLLAPNRT